MARVSLLAYCLGLADFKFMNLASLYFQTFDSFVFPYFDSNVLYSICFVFNGFL